MFNKLLISRIKRLIKNDPYLPVQCFAFAFSNDAKCTCKYYCKYSKLSEKDVKIHKYHIDNQTSKLL